MVILEAECLGLSGFLYQIRSYLLSTICTKGRSIAVWEYGVVRQWCTPLLVGFYIETTIWGWVGGNSIYG